MLRLNISVAFSTAYDGVILAFIIINNDDDNNNNLFIY